jgi:hypothetical protein
MIFSLNYYKKFFFSDLSNKGSYFILWNVILYLTFIGLFSIGVAYYLGNNFQLFDENNQIIFKNLSFGHGQLIQNYVEKKEFFFYMFGIKFYLKKTLALPYLIVFLSSISKNFYIIVILKNTIIYTIFFFSVYFFSVSKKIQIYFFYILLFIPIFIHYNFFVSLNIVYEDCLIAILLPSLFLILISDCKYKIYFISFFVFVLYFVKSSTFFICLFVPIIFFFLEKFRAKNLIPLFFVIFAILIWGFYGFEKTKRFPVGSSSSSINSWVMSYAFNDNFHKY